MANLIKNAGNLGNPGRSALLNKNWTRQTVYYTHDNMPIFMTKDKKFFAYTLEFTKTNKLKKTYKPQAAFYMENGKLKPLINLIALPKLLRMYLKEQPQNINYKDNNKANLYSKERTISVKQYKQNMKEHGNREKRYINLNDRIRVNNYLKYNESLQSYKTNKKMWIANKTITQNNVDFLKRYRNNMIKYALEDRDETNSEGPPDPYSSAMNSIGYKINLAQNMVNKAKIKEQKVNNKKKNT